MAGLGLAFPGRCAGSFFCCADYFYGVVRWRAGRSWCPPMAITFGLGGYSQAWPQPPSPAPRPD
jgi:hypothetical protein